MLQFTEKLKRKEDIYQFMCSHGKELLSDRDFQSHIKIEHLDGSKFEIMSCRWDQCEEKIYIWSEHCGYFYFFKDDLREMESKTFKWEEDEFKFKIVEHNIMNFHFND